ncbi:lytic transglycosylase domain-containing protein [Methylophaga sp.]|uniref:lytic transglycosylase domain-containing protein n=1 Tax=Methylophaga sp. TaxID=2024840 RepID=UPI003A94DD48
MDFNALMDECAPNVSPVTMAAIVKQESNFNPFAVGVNGDYVLERQPKTKEEALEVVAWLEQQGQTNLDLGLGQISRANRAAYQLSNADSFDACLNIQIAADILTQNYTRAVNSGLNGQEALTAAISSYNTGSQTAGFENGYVQKVINNVSPETVTVPALKNSSQAVNAPAKKSESKELDAKKFPPQSVYSSLVSAGEESIYKSDSSDVGVFVYGGAGDNGLVRNDEGQYHTNILRD